MQMARRSGTVRGKSGGRQVGCLGPSVFSFWTWLFTSHQPCKSSSMGGGQEIRLPWDAPLSFQGCLFSKHSGSEYVSGDGGSKQALRRETLRVVFWWNTCFIVLGRKCRCDDEFDLCGVGNVWFWEFQNYIISRQILLHFKHIYKLTKRKGSCNSNCSYGFGVTQLLKAVVDVRRCISIEGKY